MRLMKHENWNFAFVHYFIQVSQRSSPKSFLVFLVKKDALTLMEKLFDLEKKSLFSISN